MGRKPHPLPSATPLLLSALRDFTEYYPDKCAGIILTAKLTLLGTIDLWIMFLFYKGPSPPPGVFNNFTDIGPIINTCTTRTYYDLLAFKRLVCCAKLYLHYRDCNDTFTQCKCRAGGSELLIRPLA